MKYLLVIFCLFLCLSGVVAQEKHFVFIQSDNNQPFYVSFNGKLYSSTASGYLIIPKVDDGNYDFSIGFAKNAFPEQTFHYEINNKDLGFTLKNFGEKGWGLFNLQSLSVTMGENRNSDNISKALSQKDAAADDAEPVISFDKKTKALKPAGTPAPNAIDTSGGELLAANTQQKDQEVQPNSSAGSTLENKNVAGSEEVTKVSESKVEDGVHLGYVEADAKKGDTIDVIIPSDKSLSGTEGNNPTSAPDESTVKDTTASKADVVSNEGKDSLKFLDLNDDKSKKDVRQEGGGSDNNVVTISNSKCKNIATDNDYVSLRRKMAKETTDDKMINVARKAYRNKCFTTRQIKSLSTLFLSDEGRFNFFNASYNSVTDISEYSTLQSEFIDPAFIDRFKGILK